MEREHEEQRDGKSDEEEEEIVQILPQLCVSGGESSVNWWKRRN